MKDIFGGQSPADDFEAKVAGQPREESGDGGQAEEEKPRPEDSADPGQADNDEVEKLADKFKTREDLVEGLAHIGDKLGRSIDREAVKEVPTGALEEEYRRREKELGSTSDLDLTRRENQKLKQEIESLSQRLQDLEDGTGEPQTQPRDPESGRFASPEEGESPGEDDGAPEEDEEYFQQLESDAGETIASIVRRTLEERERLESERGKEDRTWSEIELDEDVKNEMLKVMRENPLLNAQELFPQGGNLEYAHAEARRRLERGEAGGQSRPTPFSGQAITEEQLEAQKRAAGISSGGGRRPGSEESADIEEQIRRGLTENSGLGGSGLPI